MDFRGSDDFAFDTFTEWPAYRACLLKVNRARRGESSTAQNAHATFTDSRSTIFDVGAISDARLQRSTRFGPPAECELVNAEELTHYR